MKNKNKKYVIAIKDSDEKNIDIDILTYENGKPRYFSHNSKAMNFLEKLYDSKNIDLQPFVDDGVILMTVN